MKTIAFDRYGPPEKLEFREVDRPTFGVSDVLVRVRAASVNPLDWHFMRGTPYLMRPQLGLLRPKSNILGVDFAGTVEAVGSDVTQFHAGDEVFGSAHGTLAEYVATHQDAVLPRPANLTFEQAAAVPTAGFTALQGLRDHGRLQAGQKVLVVGAGGGVGTFAVQIGKALGAEVTGVCSTANVDLVRSIGADKVIDYTKEDYTSGLQQYDLIFDMAGSRPFSRNGQVLAPNGTYVMVGGPSGEWLSPIDRLIKMKVFSLLSRSRFTFFVAKVNKIDLLTLTEMLETGKVTPIVGRTYPLAESAEAMRYLETGHASGKIIITA